LPRSLADVLSSKEGLEDASANGFRDPSTRVLDSDFSPLTFPLRLYGYGALSFRTVSDDVVDGMRGINQQIEDCLVKLSR
jgi:hypothetical protein